MLKKLAVVLFVVLCCAVMLQPSPAYCTEDSSDMGGCGMPEEGVSTGMPEEGVSTGMPEEGVSGN